MTFWEHSFGVGIVAKIIAQRARYMDTEKAYLAGIIHDIGEVFLSYYYKDDFLKIIEKIKDQPHKLVDAEDGFWGTDHTYVGLAIAQKWNFPSEYCDVIAYHHHPELASQDPNLVAIVNIADLFCSVRQLNYGGREWVSFNLAEEKAWDILKEFAPHIAKLDIERFCYELDDRVPEVQDLVKSIFEGMAME
jgi:putative nucleotidyltransferase with HDIG domain